MARSHLLLMLDVTECLGLPEQLCRVPGDPGTLGVWLSTPLGHWWPLDTCPGHTCHVASLPGLDSAHVLGLESGHHPGHVSTRHTRLEAASFLWPLDDGGHLLVMTLLLLSLALPAPPGPAELPGHFLAPGLRLVTRGLGSVLSQIAKNSK